MKWRAATTLIKLDEFIHVSSDGRDEVMDAVDEDLATQEKLHEDLQHRSAQATR